MHEIRKTFTEKSYYLDLIDLSPEALKLKYDLAEKPDDILFYGYLYQQKKCFGLDYNDLIIFTLEIFDVEPRLALRAVIVTVPGSLQNTTASARPR